MKRNLLTLIIGAVLIIIFGLLLFVFQVRQSEVAVVTRFGRPDREKTDPGAYGRWPWPIENVYKLDQRLQNFEDKLGEPITADNNNLLVTVYVGWRITDAKTFFPKFAGGSIPVAERQLEDIVSQAKIAIVGKHPLSDFVNANEQEIKFDAIEAEIKAIAQAQLAANNWGISIEYLGLKKLGLPESVTEAVFGRMRADREKQVQASLSGGDAEAQKIRSAAEAEAAKTLATAEAEGIRIRSEGQVRAAELLPVFESNPALAHFDLRLKGIEQLLQTRSTLIFDPRTPPFDLFSGIPTNRPAK